MHACALLSTSSQAEQREYLVLYDEGRYKDLDITFFLNALSSVIVARLWNCRQHPNVQCLILFYVHPENLRCRSSYRIFVSLHFVTVLPKYRCVLGTFVVGHWGSYTRTCERRGNPGRALHTRYCSLTCPCFKVDRVRWMSRIQRCHCESSPEIAQKMQIVKEIAARWYWRCIHDNNLPCNVITCPNWYVIFLHWPRRNTPAECSHHASEWMRHNKLSTTFLNSCTNKLNPYTVS